MTLSFDIWGTFYSCGLLLKHRNGSSWRTFIDIQTPLYRNVQFVPYREGKLNLDKFHAIHVKILFEGFCDKCWNILVRQRSVRLSS